MTVYHPPLQLQLLIALFAVAYFIHLFRRLRAGRIDLFDFATLSMVAILPAAVILVPGVAPLLSALTGATLPFTVLFGALLFVMFVASHRLTSRLHNLETLSRKLVQDVGLLRLELEELRRQVEPTAAGPRV